MKKFALFIAVVLTVIVIGCTTPKPAKACNGFGGVGVGVGVGGSFDQFGNPIGAAFAPSYLPSYGLNSYSSFQSFNTVPTFAPSFVNVNPSFGFSTIGFNGVGINPAFATFNARGGLLGSRIRVGGVGFNNIGFNSAFFNPAFVGARFNSFAFNPFIGFNAGFNNNVAFGRFGAVRPLAVSRNGNLGVRGPLGFFHPFRANGRATFLPRFR